MDVKLTYLHEPDKNYMVRVCMLVEEALLTAPGSVIEQCMECDRPIWVAANQPMPDPPEGMHIDGEVRLCLQCTAVHAMLDDEPMKWIGPEST